jgi:hypothetical protein
MGLLNNFKDRFKNAEFSVAPNKKLKTISKDFKSAFELELVFYKGKRIAEDSLTLKQLNDKTSSDIKKNSDAELKLKASMNVKDVEKAFLSNYGTTVQIKRSGKLVPDEITLGQAARGEY